MAKKVFIATLNWGLGHATRSVPIIDYYLSHGDEVVLGSDGESLSWLKNKYPDCKFFTLPSYGISYSNNLPFAIKMIQSLPKIQSAISEEKKLMHELQKEHGFDLIISDNRYGIYESDIPSYIICHQLNIDFPLFKKQIFKIQRRFLSKFDGCIVPDYSGEENLAGKLSHLEDKQDLGIPVYYVGPLTRFSVADDGRQSKEAKFDYCALCSGPEPFRSNLVGTLVSLFNKTEYHVAIASYGVDFSSFDSKNIQFFDQASDEELKEILNDSSCIISRAGYTTIMDLTFLQKKAVLIPTPGQTEQEYLGQYLSDKGFFGMLAQEHISLESLQSAKKADYSSLHLMKNQLNQVLENL